MEGKGNMSDEANSLSVNLDKCYSILSRAASNDLIPILQEMQEEYGYLPMAAMEEVSVQTGIPLSRIYGVVTFYSQFSLVPRGKHTVRLCAGTACHIKGAPDIGEKIAEAMMSIKRKFGGIFIVSDVVVISGHSPAP